ncbi:aspartate/glutamate racemase family protein [Paracoccus sediminis]|uniref:Aspartate racemase n=1 Tax=Paracoccus sediminis TaxID=1214787 RepID=A0A238XTU1_9RHOB|nr:aspartate/glutamate racemase family protein [Paracoccus sediminis]SNR61978.1 aspartate racemase [Paracoccus sediminis]
MMRRVGILGGMGPEATILIMQKVLAGIEARDDADHVPLIVDQNPQVPSRIRHLLEGGGDDPAPVLAGMARRLLAGGAEALAMPCNTAHHYADAIRAAVPLPFLDMVDRSVAHAARLAGSRGTIGVLGSPALRRVGLFDAPLARHGLTSLYPDDDDAMLKAIRHLKSPSSRTAARQTLAQASAALLDRGCTVQMIACTEFSLIPDAVSPHATVFDTLDRLAQAILAFSTGWDGPPHEIRHHEP